MEELKQNNKNNIKSNKRFIILYILFIIILLIFTAFAFLFTINFLSIKDGLIWIEEIKESSDDVKYTIEAYSDTYSTNAIKIVDYYDVDGNVSEQYPDNDDYGYKINYIQISGLKDEKIENKINETLKNKAYEIKDKYVSTSVSSNFSNILSVSFNSWGESADEANSKFDTYNVNLATGVELKLEDLFISSAPINSYIADGLYETLAWSNLGSNDDSGTIDMNNIDTSNYEDYFLIAINNYNKNKNTLKFCFTANTVSIYNLVDDSIIANSDFPFNVVNINLIKYMDSVAMYKKFITDESIFKDDSLAFKDVIVFTEPPYSGSTTLNYGMLQTNIFIEDVYSGIDIDDNVEGIVLDKIVKLSEENKSDLLNNNDRSMGMFAQRSYFFSIDAENKFIIIHTSTSKTTCSIEYFRRYAFLDYIKMKLLPAGDVVTKMFHTGYADMFPNLNIESDSEEWYYNMDTGELLGHSFEEATKKKTAIIEEITNATPAPENSVTVQSVDDTSDAEDNNSSDEPDANSVDTVEIN